MNSWISVKERVPPQDKQIIVYGKHTDKVWCTEIYVTREGEVLDWYTYRDVPIWHWMPLPEPPKD